MKLTTITQVTLDGVTQGNGGASPEDRAGGFDRGGWALGAGDATTHKAINDLYDNATAFLFGRRTYELFAMSWGGAPVDKFPGFERTWRALDERPKYIASTTLTDPTWAGSEVLTGDLASAVRALKAGGDGELQVHGSGTLVQWLLENDLVDELVILTVPVILGQGARLFAQNGPRHPLALIESNVDSQGVTIQRFSVAASAE